MPGSPFVAEVMRVFDASGVDLAALGLAWARVAPTVAIVPAFGLKGVPAPVRGVFGLALAACIAPAVGVMASAPHAVAVPWLVRAVEEIARGLPIAIAAAVPLWAATMAGGAIDALRGASDQLSAPTVEGRATTLGVPLSLLACAIFFATGGPARVVSALAHAELGASPALAASRDLVGGITLSLAIGAPILVAAIVVEIGGALVARAASPAQIHALLAPLRSLVVLAAIALVIDRVAVVMAMAMTAR